MGAGTSDKQTSPNKDGTTRHAGNQKDGKPLVTGAIPPNLKLLPYN